jgi:hypothetical protein
MTGQECFRNENAVNRQDSGFKLTAVAYVVHRCQQPTLSNSVLSNHGEWPPEYVFMD